MAELKFPTAPSGKLFALVRVRRNQGRLADAAVAQVVVFAVNLNCATC